MHRSISRRFVAANARRNPANSFNQFTAKTAVPPPPPPPESIRRVMARGAPAAQKAKAHQRGLWSSAASKIPAAKAFVKKHWFTLAVPPMAFGCYQNPDIFRKGGVARVQEWKEAALMGIFLSTGLGLKVSAMAPLARQVKTHTLIQGGIFLGCPLIFSAVAYGFLEPLGVPKPLITGFIFTACLPTTVGTSLAFTTAAKGELGVSMFNVATSNMGGILLTPALCLALTGMESNIDAAPLLGKLTQQVMLPALAGMALGWRFPKQVGRVASVVSKMPQICVMPLLANAFSDSFAAEAHTDVDGKSLGALLAATVFVNCVLMRGMYSAAGAAKLPEATRRSAAFLGSQKTAALGVPLLALMYQGDENLGMMTLPLMLFHAVQCVTSTAFIMFCLA